MPHASEVAATDGPTAQPNSRKFPTRAAESIPQLTHVPHANHAVYPTPYTRSLREPRGLSTTHACSLCQPRGLSATHTCSPRGPQSLSRNLRMFLMRTTRFIPHLTHVPYASHGVYPQLTHVPYASHGVYPRGRPAGINPAARLL
jgi:hypothetical protein